jgi:hypothetical protein
MKADIITGTAYIQILQVEFPATSLYLELDAWPKNEHRLWAEVQAVFEHGKKKHNGKIQEPSVQFEHLTQHALEPDGSIDAESGLSNKAHCAARALLLFYSLIAED